MLKYLFAALYVSKLEGFTQPGLFGDRIHLYSFHVNIQLMECFLKSAISHLLPYQGLH